MRRRQRHRSVERWRWRQHKAGRKLQRAGGREKRYVGERHAVKRIVHLLPLKPTNYSHQPIANGRLVKDRKSRPFSAPQKTAIVEHVFGALTKKPVIF